ncbi:TonB-like protein [Pseudoduganella lurida]|uniref:TonB-like protein n=1 Tax=Pseudoduganella lurida TaxID=1036180 RepID=A0A562R0H7_9BURK|nr:energy transducer TonB [Pseudoduganella lurida]TWI61886.1 TonB-like protein [Pseudoduganella lurida]
MRSLVAVTALLALCASSVQADEYRMKAEEARTGTLLKRDAGFSSLPFDKTWEQLSEKDKARVRSMYVSMGPDDEPPFPAKGYKRLMRNLGAAQEKLQAEGMLDLGVMVGPDGRATEVKVYSSPDEQFVRVAANVLMLEQYKPARCHGIPCAQEFPFRFTFRLVH